MRGATDEPLRLVRRVLRFPASAGNSDDHFRSPVDISYRYNERLPGNILGFPKSDLPLASCEVANDIPRAGSAPEALRDAMETLLSRRHSSHGVD